MASTEYARIRKGVKPYGGKLVAVLDRRTYPNGRQVVGVVVGTRPIIGPYYGPDVREYAPDEIEPVSAKVAESAARREALRRRPDIDIRLREPTT